MLVSELAAEHAPVPEGLSVNAHDQRSRACIVWDGPSVGCASMAFGRAQVGYPGAGGVRGGLTWIRRGSEAAPTSSFIQFQREHLLVSSPR